MKRVTESEVAAAAKRFKENRIAAGKPTWLSVEYYNGACHLHEVNAETEAHHCSLRHVSAGTKREMLQYIYAASF